LPVIRVISEDQHCSVYALQLQLLHCAITTTTACCYNVPPALSLQYAATASRYGIVTRASGCCLNVWPGVQGKSGIGMYNQFEKERDQGNFELLPELHAILSGMKVLLFFLLLSFLCTPLLPETTQMSYSHQNTVTIGMIARAMGCRL